MGQHKFTRFPGQYHSRIEHREPPASLIALREELPKHPVIYERASNGRSFEECLSIIAAELRIVLDGYYDVPDLCDLLVGELRKQSALVLIGANGFVSSRLPSDLRLVPARIVETANAVRLENAGLTAAAGLIIPESVRSAQKEEVTVNAAQEASNIKADK